VILGCVNVIADEMNPARVAALRLGMGEAMVAFTVQINCGSGMQSIDNRLPLYPRRHFGFDSRWRRGKRSATRRWCGRSRGVRWFAGLAGAKGILARLAALAKNAPLLFQADHWAGSAG